MVSAKKNIQKTRVLKREGWDEKRFKQILDQQLSDKEKRLSFQYNYDKFRNETKKILRNSGIDCIDIKTGEDYAIPLINFFRDRSHR